MPPSPPPSLPAAVPLQTTELREATGGFAATRQIGEGGFGSVFKAEPLPSLRHAGHHAGQLAVKVGCASRPSPWLVCVRALSLPPSLVCLACS